MEKIKILMVLGNTRLAGTQAFIMNLLRNLDLEKFQIDWAVNNEGEGGGISQQIRDFGCNIFFLPYFKVYNYFSFVKAWRIFLKGHHYDIVHAHSTNSAAIYLRIAKQLGCVTIAHSHSAGYRGNKIQQLAKRVFAKGVKHVADYWFACSDSAALRLFGKNYKTYPRYYTIPNAIDVEAFKYNEETARRVRKQLGISDTALVCGHVGSFTSPKNHIFLLRIFDEVLKRNPDARLVCCGIGEKLPAIKEMAGLMGIIDKITFTGAVLNVSEYMMAMDVFVFPSLFEGFPVSVIEAEASGLPIIMSDTITNEIDLTDLIHRYSIDETPDVWAKAICETRFNDRLEYNSVIANTSYCIHSSSQLVSSLYFEMSRKSD